MTAPAPPRPDRRASVRYVAMASTPISRNTWRVDLTSIRYEKPRGDSFSFEITSWIDVCRIDRKQARKLLTFLGGAEIIHLDQQFILQEIDYALVSLGLKPLDNRQTDLSELARKVNLSLDGPIRSFDIDTLGSHSGVLPNSGGEEGSRERALRIAKIFCGLGLERGLDGIRTAGTKAPDTGSPGSISVSAPTDHPALPNPGIPDPAPGSWRTTPWSGEERSQAADLFRDGKSLEDLSIIFSRSPSALHARLLLDGVIASDQEEPDLSGYRISLALY